MSIVLLILGLILFVLLVVVHEFGHFITARRNGVKVLEFGIGFPPRAWARKTKKGFIFSINWLPLGGFVRLKGEHDADSSPGTYGAASLWAKVKIMIAGVAMNLVAAFILLTFLALVGMPQLISNQFSVTSDTKLIKNEVLIGAIEPNSPAAHAGLIDRDQLVGIQPPKGALQLVKDASMLPELTSRYAGQTVTVVFKRNNQQQVTTVTFRDQQTVIPSQKTSNPKGYLGVSPTDYTLKRSSWSSPVVALGLIKQFTVLTFQGLGRAVGGLLRGNTAQASAQVSGPVGIFVLLKDGSTLGYQFILIIIAVISLTLAIMNVLPIPALDGGKLFVTLLYRVVRKPLSVKAEDRIHGTGFALLMVLVVLITIVDVKRFF